MARGENPGVVISVQTTLTYDATKDFGHAQAGQDLLLEAITTGNNAGKYQLLTENGKPAGKFIDLDKDGVASMMIIATPMIMKQAAQNGVTPGNAVVGGPAVDSVNGYVKNAPSPGNSYSSATVGRAINARGYCTEVLDNTAGGRVLVLIPA